MSSSTDYVQSAEFPENYGDFQLVSSNHVIFSFPRFLLSHGSPVFKDMLRIGTGDSSDYETDKLQLTEDSTTLDQLLRFLDTTKKPLPIHMDTVEGLLESAQKYQVEQVFDYWEEQMIVRDVEMHVIGIRHPMMSFFLAARFRRDEFARLALREFIRAPDSNLDLPKGFMVEHRRIIHLTRLRQERSRYLIDYIYDFHRGMGPNDCCTEQAMTMMGAKTIPLVLELMKEPSWATFERNMSVWPGCPVKSKGHHKGSRVKFESWKRKILEEEMALPETAQYLLFLD
ncbi:hypothetical protein FRC15_008686 [Serendipita sp. 397]|nr:hypothetical protein FRC15_008686 [Serendipita sp. 397]